MAIVDNTELTPKEHMLMEYEKEQNALNREYTVRLKELEIELKREENKAKIELKHLESKWASWLRLPSLLLKLPMLVVMSLAYVVAVAKKYDPPKKFWELLS